MATATERIEDLRVAWERDLERAMATQQMGARPSRGDPGAGDPRVRLERTMAERVHRVANEAAQRVGCADAFLLYQTPREPPHLSGQVLMSETPFGIRLIGPVASVLDDGALAALIGHELGHWLALGPRANPPSTLLQAWERGASSDICRLCTLAAELTADRISLIAAGGEIEAAVRLEVAIQTLDSPLALGLREMDHLEHLRRQVEARETAMLRDDGYPSSAFRLFASWLFWRSELHKELTGVGPGDITLRDVDAELRVICDAALAREPAPEVSNAGDLNASSKRRSVRPGAQRVTPSSVRSPLEDQAQVVASSVASTVGRILAGFARWTGFESSPRTDSDLSIGDDEVDDLESRFRALERHEATREVAQHQTIVPEDLEARFRELEERQRSK